MRAPKKLVFESLESAFEPVKSTGKALIRLDVAQEEGYFCRKLSRESHLRSSVSWNVLSKGRLRKSHEKGHQMKNFPLSLSRFLADEEGQDIAEYAVMLAVILVIVVGTIRLIGSNANTVFSQAASSMQ